VSIDNQATTVWWAVQVHQGRERLAATGLVSRGYEILLAMYHEPRRWSDRVRKVERALFPGYVFCQVAERAVDRIVSAPGVIRVVGNGSGPVPIPPAQIASIRRIVETQLPVSPWPFIKVGQRVRVEVGPLHGLEGIVLTTKGGRRLLVSIPLLQRSVGVELNADWVSVPV
jgi:transcription antitermination factor NusG